MILEGEVGPEASPKLICVSAGQREDFPAVGKKYPSDSWLHVDALRDRFFVSWQDGPGPVPVDTETRVFYNNSVPVLRGCSEYAEHRNLGPMNEHMQHKKLPSLPCGL